MDNPEIISSKDNDLSVTTLTNVFLIWTTVFYLIILAYSWASPSDNQDVESITTPPEGIGTLKIIYFVLMVLLQFYYNSRLFKSFCGNNDELYPYVIFYTLLPNLIFFGLILMLLETLPYWKAPFANVFGYFVVSVLRWNSGETTSQIVANLTENQSNSNQYLQTIKKLYDDDAWRLLCTITPKTFNDKWFNYYPKGENTDNEHSIYAYNNILIKDWVAQYLWAILAGILTINIGFNSVFSLNKGCVSGNPDNITSRINELYIDE